MLLYDEHGEKRDKFATKPANPEVRTNVLASFSEYDIIDWSRNETTYVYAIRKICIYYHNLWAVMKHPIADLIVILQYTSIKYSMCIGIVRIFIEGIMK